MLDEAGKALDEMEGEARSAPLQFRAEMLAWVEKLSMILELGEKL